MGVDADGVVLCQGILCNEMNDAFAAAVARDTVNRRVWAVIEPISFPYLFVGGVLARPQHERGYDWPGM